MTDKRYVTTKDITIPAGTEIQIAPHTISRAVRFGSILLGVTKDVTSEWTIPLDEGLETGLVKEIGGLIMENDK